VATATLIAATAAWLAAPHLQPWFARYFGLIPPALAVVVLGSAALLLAPWLRQRGYWGTPHVASLAVAALLVLCFAAFIIVADRLIGFPSDINAPLPWSLLYYPAMGFAAQVALHLLPLAAIVWTLPDIAQKRPWTVMALSSCPEAAFQAASNHGAASGLVALQLVGFGIAEVYLLRRFGFGVMFAFRLGYYLVWHILWSQLRAGQY